MFGGIYLQTALFGVATHCGVHFAEPPNPITVLLLVMLMPVTSMALQCVSSGIPTIGTVLAVYATYIFSLTSSIILYRLSPFHPLASFPGPIWYKMSKLSGLWVSWTGQQHRINKKLHDKYGCFVRTGPNEISVVDVSAIGSVLGASGLPKGEYYEARQDPSAPRNLVVLVGEPHANRRRLWNRGMSSDSLKDYEIVIAKRSQQLVEKLESERGPVDLGAWFGYFTFDFMGDMAFGGGFEMLRDGGDKAGLWHVLERFAVVAAVVSHIPWASRILHKIPFISGDLQRLRKVGVDSASSRLKAGASTKDLWYHLSDEAGLEKEPPLVKDVVADGALAILAGTDTTSAAMTSVFYFLLSNPECYTRVQTEVDTVYPKDEDALDAARHGGLSYLNACISEALRLHPPAATGGPRQVPRHSGGKVIADRFVPEGTQVYLPPYSLHRDARYFSNPEVFRPDRWLVPGEGEDLSAFIPFSYGPANCVGRNLARREMLMVVSLLVQKFKISFAKDFDAGAWPDTIRDHFVSTRGPLMVELEAR